MKTTSQTLAIVNISQLLTLRSSVTGPRAGKSQSDLGIIENGAVLISGDKILEVGKTATLKKKISRKTKVIDAKGKVVTPGLVDSHTHLVFAGSRADEFELRIQGKSYQEIAQMGGGINSTVQETRQASKKELFDLGTQRLDRMLYYGTTTVEAKSGYGLSTEAELKILEVIKRLNQKHKVDIVPTFLGAHAIPEEFKIYRKDYIRILTEEMIPQVAKRKLAEFCDVFCENGYFSVEESRKILETGKKIGLKPKVHADELGNTGGSQVAADAGAVSADHLVYAIDDDIEKMKRAGVIAVLLPSTSFFLVSRYAPARKMIENDLPVALATDFNPGTSMTESMQMVMSLACVNLKMTPAEALVASTINSAYAINRGEQVGSLEPGKKADIVIWEVAGFKEIPYHYGVNLVQTVIKNGKIAFQNR
ncbi:MAG TPA: imidazolonepropionase [candidate division Zixibacteria bacterium]|nr:imidazolonepropionase [candidate division Zixibacteria bacterium]